MEMWKPIKGTNNMYQVSSKGVIKGLPREVIRKDGVKGKFLRERILKGAVNSSGYMTVTLPNGSRFIHRLVAEAFVENTLNKEQVNHKDGNKFNNDWSNLEWMSPKENSQHAFTLEANQEWNKGSRNPGSKLNEEKVLKIKKFLDNEYAVKEIAKEYGVSESCIRDIKRGASWATVNG